MGPLVPLKDIDLKAQVVPGWRVAKTGRAEEGSGETTAVTRERDD